MKLLLTTIAAVLLVGCGESQKSRQWSEADRALFAAADAGNIEAVKQAIAAGADVNTKDESLRTPLHWAAEGGHKEVAVLLIAKGADVNAKDSRGWTPLHLTATKEIVELLIAKGADVNAKDDDGDTPLDGAINNGETELAKLLRKHGGRNWQDEAPRISIHHTAFDGNIEAVKQHLDAGTDVNAKDKGDQTPLHYASMVGHKEIVELLITKGADVNAKDKLLGRTPLDEAIFGNHSELADLIRKHGGKTGEELKAEGK